MYSLQSQSHNCHWLVWFVLLWCRHNPHWSFHLKNSQGRVWSCSVRKLSCLHFLGLFAGIWWLHFRLLRCGDGYQDDSSGDFRTEVLPWRHVEPSGFLHSHGRVSVQLTTHLHALLTHFPQQNNHLSRMHSERKCALKFPLDIVCKL